MTWMLSTISYTLCSEIFVKKPYPNILALFIAIFTASPQHKRLQAPSYVCPFAMGHLLKVAVSCRRVLAQVVNTNTESIVAMASSMEQEFLPEYKAKLNRFPRSHMFWDSQAAAKVGKNLGNRISELGISQVLIDSKEEESRPLHYKKRIQALLAALKNNGIQLEEVTSKN
ncbi:uncharacterized protein LOC18441838 isoform X2 [Amborella trichopoda]|uniref:uncharacterized protein LOC18441838 isoform X2 n=1 Tax=Amborella trichopoda TaxID=13333 RepID=UPI0005D3FF29|nr:uncharacterized protein LOC18441838 isoform X2 [Amborella trichopoda]XP_020527664.1 uncharacterized protein LOC18441838 isoform X2 [Amborella trichopoda]XP_020527665.1 uncharacterized protein LOC18441838 isoform X2 [Amborella trichopoda]|eukprot:XP_006852127.2 uncharacterized protein LOC18441838 isoform X2 [Amborella trichopoda]